jgi:hypothetical protein
LVLPTLRPGLKTTISAWVRFALDGQHLLRLVHGAVGDHGAKRATGSGISSPLARSAPLPGQCGYRIRLPGALEVDGSASASLRDEQKPK